MTNPKCFNCGGTGWVMDMPCNQPGCEASEESVRLRELKDEWIPLDSGVMAEVREKLAKAGIPLRSNTMIRLTKVGDPDPVFIDVKCIRGIVPREDEVGSIVFTDFGACVIVEETSQTVWDQMQFELNKEQDNETT